VPVFGLMVLAGSCLVDGPDESPSTGTTQRQAEASPPAAVTMISRLPGTFSVTDDGQASYTVPLEVPAGRGLAPELALRYRSRGSNGAVGVGFSLVGASSQISRCSRTFASDGVRRAVSFTDDDVFCWDGQRLVGHVDPGDGAAQRSYRTQIESHARIVARGIGPQGPSSFQVWHRDGRILTYDMRLRGLRRVPAGRDMVPGPEVTYAWLLTRVEDRAGNFMTVEYFAPPRDPGPVEAVPVLIQYGGHTSGVAPSRSVKLDYDLRPDQRIAYLAGFGMQLTRRLRRLEMRVASRPGDAHAPVWSYELGYRTDSVTQRSLLAWLQRCHGARGCEPATRFDWDLGALDIGGARPLPGEFDRLVGARPLQAADRDGDGIDELFVHGATWAGQTSVYLRRVGACDIELPEPPDILTPPATPPPDWRPCQDAHQLTDAAARGWFVIDLDRDGVAELFEEEASRVAGQAAWMRFSPGESSERVLTAPLGAPAPVAADLDGDGRRELSYRDDAQRSIVSILPGPAGRTERLVAGAWAEPAGALTALDSDGDGADEILFVQAQSALLLRRTGRTFSAQPVNLAPERGDKLFADVNGDGLADEIDRDFQVRINTGNGFTVPHESITPQIRAVHGNPLADLGDPARNRARVVDWNRDGLQDILDLGGRVFLSNGLHHHQVVLLGGGQPLVGDDHRRAELGDFDGDGALDLVHGGARGLQLRHGPRGIPDTLLAITDGLGQRIEVAYAMPHGRSPGDEASDLPAAARCAYPLGCAALRAPVVARHRIQDGAGDSARSVSHTFSGPRSDLRGAGFLGFVRRSQHDQARSSTTVTDFEALAASPEQVPSGPLSWVVARRVAWTAHEGGTEIQRSRLQHRLRGPDPFVQELVRRDASRHFTSERVPDPLAHTGDVLHESTAEYEYHRGVLRSFFERSASGRETRILRTFEDRPAQWLWALPTHEIIEDAPTAEHRQARERWWRYDERGLVAAEGGNHSDIVTSYTRNALGQVTLRREEVRGAGARDEGYSYDAQGFLRTVRNPLGHLVHTEREPVRGLVLRATDGNGVVDTYEYDPLGRLVAAREAGGEHRTVQYLPPERRGGLRVRISSNAGLDETTELDPAGRPLARTWLQWNGAGQHQVATHTDYDERGHVVRHSLPAAVGASAHALRYTHDPLGRVLSIAYPDGSEERWQYLGLELHHRDRNGLGTTLRRNGDGEIVESLQHLPTGPITTRYGWGPFGQLATVTDAHGNVRTTEYDPAGRMRRLSDPDRGDWQLGHDGWGRLVEERGPAGTLRRTSWDALDRPVRRDTEDGATLFTWDAAAHGLGALASATSPDGIRTTYEYDVHGRLAATQVLAAGRWYRTAQTYDETGRVRETTYPAIPGAAALRVRFEYHGRELARVVDAASGQAFWSAGRYHPAGMLERQAFGNRASTWRTLDPGTLRIERQVTERGTTPLLDLGLVYSAGGDLTGRHEAVTGARDTATYDLLRRLVHWKSSPGLPDAREDAGEEHYSYDSLGNLTRVETWQAGAFAATHTYQHGFVTPGADPEAPRRLPHAITAVDGLSLRHDALGRQVAGPGRQVEYTAFDLPRRVQVRAGTAQFAYDAAQQRVLSRGPGPESIVTLGRHYEHRIADAEVQFPCADRPTDASCGAAPGSVHLATVPGPEGPVARLRWVEGPPGRPATPTVEYLHLDPQGTLAATTDERGRLLARHRYDPWGRSRGLPGSTPGESGRAPGIGYTGHRDEPALGLIDMRGRFYDPGLRQFLSPDPLIHSLWDSQSLHPYAYARNNPLTFTDPSGLEFESCTHSVQTLASGEVVTISCTGVSPLPDPLPGPRTSGGDPDRSGRTRPGHEAWDRVQEARENRRERLRERASRGTSSDDADEPGITASIAAGVQAAGKEVASAINSAVDKAQTGAQDLIQNLVGIGISSVPLLGPGLGGAGGATLTGTVTGTTAAATGFTGRRGDPLFNPSYQSAQNEPTVIGERRYTGHALDQMRNRGLTPSVVENAITSGIPSSGRGNTTVYAGADVRVVVGSDGQVVTVYPQ
jgi:RHS repeat-associated protein